MAQQVLDHTGNDDLGRTISKLDDMLTELYARAAASVSKVTVATGALATAVAAGEELTLAFAGVVASDKVFASIQYGTATTGSPAIVNVTPGTNQVVVDIVNVDAAAAINGTLSVTLLKITEN